MAQLAHKFMDMDRRVIFILLALSVLIPLLHGPLNLPVKASPEVRSIYDKIESMSPGSVLLISIDFGPSTKPELYPMSEALIRHAFAKDLRVVGMTLWIVGIGVSSELMSRLGSEYGKTYGEDYVYLGWAPGAFNVIVGMGQDIYKTFPQDYYGTDTASMPVLQGVRTLRDIDYVVDIATGDPGIEAWIVYGREKYGFELGGGCTAVTAPGMYIYVNSGQINGLMGGMRGAAEYETLIERTGQATVGMDVQSVAHLLIIVLIVASNAAYFATKFRQRGGVGAGGHGGRTVGEGSTRT